MDSLMDPDVVWGFQDESAQRISSRTARLWSLGKPIRRTNTDRINANIFGFYAVRGNSVAFSRNIPGPRTCASSWMPFAKRTESRKVVLILDNGPVHHLKAVLEHAEELDIHFVYLPPYYPQFNPIELVWKSIKRVVSGMFILERYQLIDVVRENFMNETSKTSYLEGWMKTFF